MAIRVMLADDHRMLREGLRRALTDQGLDVVGEARDGNEAIRLATELEPDVVLMEVMLPELDGIEATRLIKQAVPEVKIVMLTVHADLDVMAASRQAGASGFPRTMDVRTAARHSSANQDGRCRLRTGVRSSSCLRRVVTSEGPDCGRPG